MEPSPTTISCVPLLEQVADRRRAVDRGAGLLRPTRQVVTGRGVDDVQRPSSCPMTMSRRPSPLTSAIVGDELRSQPAELTVHAGVGRHHRGAGGLRRGHPDNRRAERDRQENENQASTHRWNPLSQLHPLISAGRRSGLTTAGSGPRIPTTRAVGPGLGVSKGEQVRAILSRIRRTRLDRRQDDERQDDERQDDEHVDIHKLAAEIEAEVRARRAAGEYPPGFERELDQLFDRFAPPEVSNDFDAALERAEDLVIVDPVIPVASNSPVLGVVKRVMSKLIGWYHVWLAQQISGLATAINTALRLLGGRVVELEHVTGDVARTRAIGARIAARRDDDRVGGTGDRSAARLHRAGRARRVRRRRAARRARGSRASTRTASSRERRSPTPRSGAGSRSASTTAPRTCTRSARARSAGSFCAASSSARRSASSCCWSTRPRSSSPPAAGSSCAACAARRGVAARPRPRPTSSPAIRSTPTPGTPCSPSRVSSTCRCTLRAPTRTSSPRPAPTPDLRT